MNEAGDAYSQIMVDDVLVYMVDGWEGLMDARTGRIVTPAIYWNFEMASKDLLRAWLLLYWQHPGRVKFDRIETTPLEHKGRKIILLLNCWQKINCIFVS